LGADEMLSLYRRGMPGGGEVVREDRLAGGVVDEGDYRLTDKGHQQLATLGPMLPPRLSAVRCCIDSTEQRHHIAGALGRVVLDAFDIAGWIVPARTHRAVRVTSRGIAGVHDHLGIAWPPASTISTPSGGSDSR
jgi:hypothetical protein